MLENKQVELVATPNPTEQNTQASGNQADAATTPPHQSKGRQESESTLVAPEKLLEQCEVTIRQGIKHFLAVGQALSTIRAKKLYRLKQYTTFEDYGRKEWNITRAHANNLILAFAVEEEMSTVVDKPVLENEHQARKYRRLDDGSKAEVKRAVAKGAKMGKALSAATRETAPSDKLQVKKMVIQICRILESTTEEEEAYDALQPVLAWAKEYEKRQEALKEARAKDVEWMKLLQAEFPIQKAKAA
jgi:hypothetical protein